MVRALVTWVTGPWGLSIVEPPIALPLIVRRPQIAQEVLVMKASAVRGRRAAHQLSVTAALFCSRCACFVGVLHCFADDVRVL